MDARFENDPADPVIVTGCGHVIVENEPCDPTPFLKAPKLRKYMGVQDDLAVVAAARALQSAGLTPSPPTPLPQGGEVRIDPERIGLYLVVGYIPFEQSDLDPLLEASLEDGRISMERFSTAGFRAVNGLLTFRCLPNMPAFHVSVNCNIQGPYFVTYPGPAQFYLALEEAVWALRDGVIDVALVGGVAHQRNFLVEYHFGRIELAISPEDLRDAAGCLILERSGFAKARGRSPRGPLTVSVNYKPFHPFAQVPPKDEEICHGFDNPVVGYLGPASLPVRMSVDRERGGQGRRILYLQTRDGFYCNCSWEPP